MTTSSSSPSFDAPAPAGLPPAPTGATLSRAPQPPARGPSEGTSSEAERRPLFGASAASLVPLPPLPPLPAAPPAAPQGAAPWLMPLMAVPEQGRIRRGSEPWVRPITPAQPMNAEVLHDVGSEGRAALAWAPEHPQPLLPLALKPQGPRPAIVTMPTLGVVPAHPLGHRLCSPHDWPQFNARLGELCYLSAYPGDKRRDRCADWLKDYDRLDGEYHRDISEMHGGQQDRWLISPSVAQGSFKKFRYGYGRQGEAVGVLVAQTTEATLAALSRNRGPYSDWNPRPWLNRALSTQHFLHSLVLGELFAHIDVLDLINHHGKMYAVVPLFVSPAPEQLLALPQPLRKTLARRTLLGLSKILRDMHSRQAVHFNVSLDNLFLGHREVLLGGFSAAHFIGPLGLPSERTPAHEPPEMVLDDRRYDCSADIWGLGMVLMRLLCGTTTFLAPYGVPHERGLPAHFWRQYVSWHQAPGQAAPSPRRGLRKAPSLASLLGSSAPPGPQSLLHAQLSQGYAAACATDRELAGFVRKNLLSPRPPDRCQGDALVSAAALFSQAITPKDNAELDGALEPHGPMVADSRQDMLARMGHILSVWRAEANVTMAVGASVRRPSID